MATLKSIFGTALYLITTLILAADINVKTDQAGKIIEFTGPIDVGDARKLINIIKSDQFPVSRLSIESQGGNVLEALKIGKISRKVALDIEVRHEKICASACFFVFIGGFKRFAEGSEYMLNPAYKSMIYSSTGQLTKGYVGIHRPFNPKLDSTENSQLEIMREVTNFLDAQLIPRRITDIMMSRPSNDIYWLNWNDLDEIGEYPPQIEEYLIQKCGYDKNIFKKMTTAKDAGDINKYNELNSKEWQIGFCIATEKINIQQAGIKQIKAGWNPSTR